MSIIKNMYKTVSGRKFVDIDDVTARWQPSSWGTSQLWQLRSKIFQVTYINFKNLKIELKSNVVTLYDSKTFFVAPS